jgi:hypothetical protein
LKKRGCGWGMDDRGGGSLPRAGRRAKAPESGRTAAGEGSGATIGWFGLGKGCGGGVLDRLGKGDQTEAARSIPRAGTASAARIALLRLVRALRVSGKSSMGTRRARD